MAGPRGHEPLDMDLLDLGKRRIWWTGRDSNPRPSGVLELLSCKPDVLRPDLDWVVYQAELPARSEHRHVCELRYAFWRC